MNAELLVVMTLAWLVALLGWSNFRLWEKVKYLTGSIEETRRNIAEFELATAKVIEDHIKDCCELFEILDRKLTGEAGETGSPTQSQPK